MTGPRNAPRSGTYIVIRVAADYPYQVPAGLDGKWFDFAEIPYAPGTWGRPPGLWGGLAYETGRFEEREDGAVAQVWEIR